MAIVLPEVLNIYVQCYFKIGKTMYFGKAFAGLIWKISVAWIADEHA